MDINDQPSNAHGQLELAEGTSKHCLFALIGGKLNSYYIFKKSLYGLTEIPTILEQKSTDTDLYIPAWLDDTIVITRGTKQENLSETEVKT